MARLLCIAQLERVPDAVAERPFTSPVGDALTTISEGVLLQYHFHQRFFFQDCQQTDA
jgi:hypothetical protein